MTASPRRIARPVIASALAGIALTGVMASAARRQDLTIQSGDVRVECPLTVGGSFNAKTTALSGTINLANIPSSHFVVDLTTLRTGIALRDEHLRSNYLEVQKGEGYDRATVSSLQVTGLNPQTLDGRGSFTGTIRLHGVDRPVGGTVQVRASGTTRKVSAEFPVTIADFNIAKPRYLGMGVKDVVTVHIAFEAH